MNLLKRTIKAGLYYSGISGLYGRFFLQNKAVILVYHRITSESDNGGLCVTPEVFAMQMEYLAKHYNVLPLSKLVEHLQTGRQIPSRSCVVTFDDGTIDNFEIAFPILKKLSIPATFFVIGSRMEDPFYFNSNQADALLANGQAIGAHTQTHPKLTKATDEELLEELEVPFKNLNNAHAIDSPCFAYPYGDFNPQVAEAVMNTGYCCAVTTQPGFVQEDSDLFALPRIQIDNDSNSSVSLFATRLQWIPRSAK